MCSRCWKRNGVKPKSRQRTEEKNCPLCRGAFLNVPELGKLAIESMKSAGEIRTFSVGTKMPKETEAQEEKVWEIIDISKARSVKGELNREIGKWIEKNSEYKFSIKPDVWLTIDSFDKKIHAQPTALFFFGKYRKLERNVRQTKKEGVITPSVEAFIERPLLALTGSSKAVLHGAGREDIDVLMIGEGRPFVIEIQRPKIRSVDPAKLQRAINKKES